MIIPYFCEFFKCLFISAVHTASGCSFDEGSVVHNRLVEAEATCKVICGIAVAFKDTTGDIATQTTLTNDVDDLARIYLVKALSQLIDGDIIETLDVSSLIFTDGSGIQKRYAAVSRELIGILNMPLLHNTARDVVDHKASHIHGILCG